MKHLIIKLVSKNINDDVIYDHITNALQNYDGLIILDLGSDFLYTSKFMSITILNKNKITIVKPNERFKVISKLLKLDKMLHIEESLDYIVRYNTKEGDTWSTKNL